MADSDCPGGAAGPSAGWDVGRLQPGVDAVLRRDGARGVRAPKGEQMMAQFLRITKHPMPSLRESGLPADVCAVIEQAMSRDPQARPATAAEFGERLRDVQRQSVESRRDGTESAYQVGARSGGHHESWCSGLAFVGSQPGGRPPPRSVHASESLGEASDQRGLACVGSSRASAVRKSRYMLWMPVQRMGSGSQSFDRRLTTGECVNSVSRLSTRSTRVLAPRFAERDSMPGISGGRADSGLSIVTDRCTPCFKRHCVLTSTSNRAMCRSQPGWATTRQ